MKHTDTDNRQVVFYGRITASITHEMKNVLAIIKEASGLMQDILAFSKEDTCPHEDKLKDALHTIGEQVKRGVELSSRLNRFAHESEDLIESVDLNDLVAHLVALSTRFAWLKKIDLVFAPSATAIAVQTRPISLQMALFAGIECCFAALPSGGRIEIKALSENGEKRVIVNCQGTDLKDISFSETLVESHKWKFFLDLVEDIEGRHELDALHRRLSVFLPEVMEAENGNVDASNDKTE